MYQQHQKNNQNDNIDLFEGILHLNRALTYEVFSSLRAVELKWDIEKIYVFFFYDGEISENDSESAECIATQMISNYHNLMLEVEMIRIDYPAPIPRAGIIAYHRYEEGAVLRKEQEEIKGLLKKNTAISPKVRVLIAVIVGSFGNIFFGA